MPSRAQQPGLAHARQLQQLRRVDRPAAQDDLARVHPPDGPAPVRVLDADRARAVERHLRHQGARADVEVGPRHHGVQVGAGRGQPPPAVDVAVEPGEALLAVPVDVVGERVARLLRRLQERAEQRVRGRPALEDERSAVAAELVVGLGGQAVLHAHEVGQAVGVVPGGHPGVGRPPLVVQRVAPLEDHPVDAAGAAEHLAPGVRDPPAAHVRLRLGLVAPVVEPAAAGERQRGGHVDEHVPRVVAPARLQHEHAGGRVGRQAVGQRAAGRATPDDDDVVSIARHAASPFVTGTRRQARPRRSSVPAALTAVKQAGHVAHPSVRPCQNAPTGVRSYSSRLTQGSETLPALSRTTSRQHRGSEQAPHTGTATGPVTVPPAWQAWS